MALLDDLEHLWTLTSAVARFEQLRSRDSHVDLASVDGDGPGAGLSRAEALELLALGEIIGRKAGYGRQLVIGTARAAGASWAEIGQALGVSRQSAWEAHAKWIDAQARQHEVNAYEGLDEAAVAQARALAGTPEPDSR